MASILVLGTDETLLEGLAQTLVAAGHQPVLAASVSEAMQLAARSRPLVAVVERGLATAASEALRVPLLAGGALILFHPADAASTAPPAAPPAALQRLMLADLTLPLERHRLVALVQRVEERARATGRWRRQTPPEQRAL